MSQRRPPSPRGQGQQGQEGQGTASRREMPSVPRSPRTTTGTMASPRSAGSRKQQTSTTPLGGSASRLQVQTFEPTAAEGDPRSAAATAATGSDLPPQSPHPPKSPRTKPYRARGSRGRGGRRRRAAQKQAEAEAAAAALLASPASSAATAGESPRSMASAIGDEDDIYSDVDAASSYFSSPGPSPLPSPRQHPYQTHGLGETSQKQEANRPSPSPVSAPAPTPPLSPFHQQLEGLSHAASQAAAQAAAVTSSEIFDPPRIQRKMDAMAASAARTASTWSSTIDRPMETIEILTDRLCPGRQDATSDDVYNAAASSASAFPPPGLQRLRTFSSELSVSSTFDSPRARAGTDASFQSADSNYHPAPPAAATATTGTMPQIAEDLDLKGLALIEEDKDLNLVRTDTHITSMSTASTNFGGASSSQMTQQHSVTSTTTTSNSIVSSSSPRGYARPLASLEDQHLFGGGGGSGGGMGSAAPSPRSRTSSCEYSEYSTASTQAILDGHPGVLPPPMSTSHHSKKTEHPQYESRFLAGGYGGLAGAEGGRFWDDDEHGDVYSFSDESSMQSNGYFFRESGATPRSMGLPPPPSASKASGGHPAAGRGRTFTDPTHAAMGFNQPAPIPFAVEQIEHAKAAALREHQIQTQGHHLGNTVATTTTTTIHRKSYAVETKHQAHPSVVGNRGRTFSEPTAGGRGGGSSKADEIDSAISQDDSASLFNISPKSFLMGQQSGTGGGDGDAGTQKPRFDYEGK